MLRKEISTARTWCMSFDGQTAAFGAPTSGVTQNYIDEYWSRKSIPITSFSTGDASESGKQLCNLQEHIVRQKEIVRPGDIRIQT